ncbi:hypothetical protein Taro_045549 [Colocasia esculenta]|uniref:Uncharacterized protein n=1 Tax=Colocasia esculenta TaxID=4460 RepID=A0A843X6M5_COLES|nr:hypothetical protein [Colocasia esculenta]
MDYWLIRPGLWPEHPKVRHWKTGLAGDQYVYWCPYPQPRARYKRLHTQKHKPLAYCRLSLSRTYNSNTGVRVSRKTTQTSTVPHCTGTNPEHNKHTCLAHKEPGAHTRTSLP